MKRALAGAFLVLLLANWAGAQPSPGPFDSAQGRQDFQINRAAHPPVIDADLNDEVWQGDPMPLGDWFTYRPSRGDKMPDDFRTEVRIAYDDQNVYFAFHCFDHEPDKIRATLSKRDAAFSDDWIAISLDSAATGQSAYHLFINPSGVQMDAINTSASGEQMEADVVWYSAGKVTSDGYIAEVRVPLQTLRFKGGADVRMGLLFFRQISRLGVSYSWPEMKHGEWVFDKPGHVRFANLRQPRLFELLPSITYGVRQEREGVDRWNAADNDTNVGVSGKFGITSSITLDGTLHPDFSQVESDAFQSEVNQRFPVFYSEKRPFFMEGMGLFNIAGTQGPGNMRTAVHTRKIVNPFWGTKVTGTAGKTTFGVLNAWDESPQDIGDRGDIADAHDKFNTIARATYALGGSNYVGGIFTDTEHAGRYNRVAGADLSYKLSSAQQFSATVLSSHTGIKSESSSNRGVAAQTSYNLNTRRWAFAVQGEHYDRDFQMDTAFYNRTGFTAGWSFGGIHFYPKKYKWLHQVTPTYFARLGHDDVQGGGEGHLANSIDFNFTRQGFLSIGHGMGHETWHGQRFKNGGWSGFGRVQLFRWISVFSGQSYTKDPYYDDVDPFQGRSYGVFAGLELQPNQHLNQSVEVNSTKFYRLSTGERVFSVTIINSKTTYQFDRHFLMRFIAQYDSSRERVLTDFLASYEVVPGTVFHAGYGSLYEKGAGLENPAPSDATKFFAVNRGLFLKASYLRRF